MKQETVDSQRQIYKTGLKRTCRRTEDGKVVDVSDYREFYISNDGEKHIYDDGNRQYLKCGFYAGLVRDEYNKWVIEPPPLDWNAIVIDEAKQQVRKAINERFPSDQTSSLIHKVKHDAAVQMIYGLSTTIVDKDTLDLLNKEAVIKKCTLVELSESIILAHDKQRKILFDAEVIRMSIKSAVSKAITYTDKKAVVEKIMLELKELLS